MAKIKKVQVEPISKASLRIKSKPEKRDILTEMFESFGIKVVDVGSQISKSTKKRRNSMG